MPALLSDSVVVVTGASSGIGRAALAFTRGLAFHALASTLYERTARFLTHDHFQDVPVRTVRTREARSSPPRSRPQG